MQFFAITTTMLLSVGISTFATFDRAAEVTAVSFDTKVEIAEFQKKIAKGAMRREKELSPKKFPTVKGSNPKKVDSNVVDAGFAGGYRNLNLVTVTLDSAGNLAASASNAAYSFGNISGSTTAKVQDKLDDVIATPRLSIAQTSLPKEYVQTASLASNVASTSAGFDDTIADSVRYAASSAAEVGSHVSASVASLSATISQTTQSSAVSSISARLSSVSSVF
jgi:hypothetical protein